MAAGILNGVRGCRLQLLSVSFNRSNEITLVADHQSIEHSNGIVTKSHENLPKSLTENVSLRYNNCNLTEDKCQASQGMQQEQSAGTGRV